MLFQELIEQHCVHRFLADDEWFAISIARYQVGVYFFYFLSNQTETDRTRGFNLRFITEAYRLEAVDDFTGLIDRLDVVLEAPRRYLGAEFAV